MIFKGQMEKKSGRNIYFDTGINGASPFFWDPPAGDLGTQSVHAGLNCLQYSKNSRLAADAY